MPYDRKEYYQKTRLYRIGKALEAYYADREAKIAYQKEYTARRRAAGWRQKNYKKPPKPEPRVILVRVPDEIEVPLPITQPPKPPKAPKPPPPPPFVWKEASFSMKLD
jgi:hypothetical protein